MFGSRFLDKGSIDSYRVYSFGNCDSRASFFLVWPNRYFCSLTPKKMGAHVDLPSSTRYVGGWFRFSRYTSMYYINGWCCIVVAVNSPMRVAARSCMNVFVTSDSNYYRPQVMAVRSYLLACYTAKKQAAEKSIKWYSPRKTGLIMEGQHQAMGRPVTVVAAVHCIRQI